MDLYNNEVVAYKIYDQQQVSLVLDILKEALKRRSNQGSVYTSYIFQGYVTKQNLVSSMSRRRNCWDNALIESLFGHLKDEVYIKSCKILKELKARIDHYMIYYNNYRYQWIKKR